MKFILTASESILPLALDLGDHLVPVDNVSLLCHVAYYGKRFLLDMNYSELLFYTEFLHLVTFHKFHI